MLKIFLEARAITLKKKKTNIILLHRKDNFNSFQYTQIFYVQTFNRINKYHEKN